jgi:carboxypeptidase Q
VAASQRIREEGLRSDGAWEKLSYLTDRIGPRLSGSEGYNRAAKWARDRFASEGHENAKLEPVRVPHWVRGPESAELLSPWQKPLAILALGGSVGTKTPLTAPVVSVTSFDELERLGSAVRGKIVLYNQPMASSGDPGRNYGQAVAYRREGADRAAPLGAVAVLVRSVTARSLGAPHTGALRYAEPAPGLPAVPKIPAAALSVEDAELLARLTRAGETVTVRLALGAVTLPDADAANVTAELEGREKPEEVVLIGAHLDSWDVGQGAQDNGAGCAIVMESLSTLRRLGLTPRRTIRAVLFANEENGLRGAAQYAVDHADETARHVAAIETDFGAGPPLGFMTNGPQPFQAELAALTTLLAPIGADRVLPGYPGEDVLRLAPSGIPLFGLMLDGSHYFDVHHSAADTLDKIDPQHLRRSVVAMATLAYVMAERPETWRSAPVLEPVPVIKAPPEAPAPIPK